MGMASTPAYWPNKKYRSSLQAVFLSCLSPRLLAASPLVLARSHCLNRQATQASLTKNTGHHCRRFLSCLSLRLLAASPLVLARSHCLNRQATQATSRKLYVCLEILCFLQLSEKSFHLEIVDFASHFPQ